MSSENFWKLFAETGDIGYYLLYKKSAGMLRPHGEKKCERAEYAR